MLVSLKPLSSNVETMREAKMVFPIQKIRDESIVLHIFHNWRRYYNVTYLEQ